MISLDASYRRHNAVAWRVLDGQAYIVSLDRGCLHKLNPVGTRMWELLNEERPLRSIIETILNEFDVDRTAVENDITDFAEKLLDAGIIVPVSPDSVPAS